MAEPITDAELAEMEARANETEDKDVERLVAEVKRLRDAAKAEIAVLREEREIFMRVSGDETARLRAELENLHAALEAINTKRAANNADAAAFREKAKAASDKRDAREKAPGKKLYLCRAEQSAEFYVYASNADEAEDLARDNADDELRNVFDTPDISAEIIDPEKQAMWSDQCPYRSDEPDDEEDVETLRLAWLEREAEAAEKARIEANQLKLFPEVPRVGEIDPESQALVDRLLAKGRERAKVKP